MSKLKQYKFLVAGVIGLVLLIPPQNLTTATVIVSNSGAKLGWQANQSRVIAQQPRSSQSEDIHVEIEPDWKIGSSGEQPNAYSITEFIREGNVIENWHELLTIHKFVLTANFGPPEDMFNSLKNLREKECPGSTIWNVIQKDEKSILYEWQAKPCLGWPEQHEIARIIDGKYNRFLIRYAAKVYQLESNLRTKWIERFSQAKIILLEVPYLEKNTLQGHQSGVTSVSFSPDGKTLASSSGIGDGTIKLWNVADGREIRSLNGHQSSVISVSFSPDGKTLASGGGANTLKLWNVADGKEIRSLTGHQSDVSSVSFSPDGKTLASGSFDSTIKLWSMADGKEIFTLHGHTSSVFSVSFSPDGKTLASGSGIEDGTIKLWSVADGKEIRSLNGHQSSVTRVSFSPDGKTLASGGGANTIKLWNVADGKEIRSLNGHKSTVWSISFSPDGKTLATGSQDKTIKLWNLETGKEICTFNGHQSVVLSLSFSPDGKTLASGSTDKTIKLWNVADCKLITESGKTGGDVLAEKIIASHPR